MKKEDLIDCDSNSTILNSIADGVFTIDNNHKITFFNKSAEEITGVTKSNAIGKFCYEIFRSNVCENDCPLKKTMNSGVNIINKSINIINKSGNKIPASITTALLKDKNGKIIGGVETFRDLSEIEVLRKEISKQYSYQDIISKNHEIKNILSILPDIAESESTVLIEGPSGSGKELFARALHNLSKRHNKPLVVINCGAIPDNLLESELFGYEKGAFTDAKKKKLGKFAIAEGGTLFLDEIGDLSPSLQVKLLRVLQEKEYEPIGSLHPIKSNARIIAATNKDLGKLVKEGKFRDDLFYRLSIVPIQIPNLQDRIEDVPILVDHFIKKFNIKTNKEIVDISDDALACLLNYNYPGNIRELENIIERAFILCKNKIISLINLPINIQKSNLKQTTNTNDSSAKILSFENAEIETINKILEKNQWNKTKTAKELGINTSTLWRKMKKLNIS